MLFGVFAALIAAALWLFYGDDTGAGKRGGGRGAVTVATEVITENEFSDIVEALGTARASESVVLTSRVSDTVARVNFDDGQIVAKGDLLVELHSVEEQALLKEANATLLEAESQYARIEDLVTRGNASTSSLDAQKRQVDEARFRVEAAKARIADRLIRAPFDGVLGLRQVSEGSFLSSNTAITTIDDIDTINLDFSVPERFIATLAPGQEVEAKVRAYPGRVFKGTVKTIDSRVDSVTRTVVVRAEISNKDRALRPGLLMLVELTSRRWQALSVPEQAVVPTGGYNYVFVVNDGEAERRAVTLGIRRPGYVEVVSGVEAGERVVTQGTMRLGRSGIKVQEVGNKAERPAQKEQGQ